MSVKPATGVRVVPRADAVRQAERLAATRPASMT